MPKKIEIEQASEVSLQKKVVVELASSPRQLVIMNEAIVEHGALTENEASSLVLPIPACKATVEHALTEENEASSLVLPIPACEATVEHGALTENEASSLVLPIQACEATVEHGALTENEASLVLSIPLTAACVPTLIVMQKWINHLSVLPPGIHLFASLHFVLSFI